MNKIIYKKIYGIADLGRVSSEEEITFETDKIFQVGDNITIGKNVIKTVILKSYNPIEDSQEYYLEDYWLHPSLKKYE